MAISASLVKELRERTGLGMMECKKALEEANGDIELSIENLRKSGQAKAAKKAGNVAAEGAIIVKIAADGKSGIMVEVNSQTDFVARDANFTAFANMVADQVLATGTTDIAALMDSTVSSESLETQRQALVQKIGENIQVRRAEVLKADGVVGAYVHGLKIGVLVGLKGGNADVARDVAMHVAASNPMVVNDAEIPADVLAKEHEIYTAQAAESGKPADIVEKMVQGRLRKYKEEVSLIHQAFVKDPDVKVGDLLKKAGAEAQKFVRYQVGEGIEKKEVDFAAEVAAAAAGN